MENLPEYMKICYLAVFNFVHEVAYDILKDYGWNILPFIKKEVFYVILHSYGNDLSCSSVFCETLFFNYFTFSGKGYACHIWWKQNGLAVATSQPLMST